MERLDKKVGFSVSAFNFCCISPTADRVQNWSVMMLQIYLFVLPDLVLRPTICETTILHKTFIFPPNNLITTK